MKGTHFLALAVVLALVDVLIPYAFLKDIASFQASYLFWTLLTLSVVIFGILYTRRWRRDS